MTTLKQQEALDCYKACNGNKTHAAKMMNPPMGRSKYRRLYDKAVKLNGADPLVKSAAKALGLDDAGATPYFWAKSHEPDENGLTYSAMVRNPITGEDVSFLDLVKDAVDYEKECAPEYELRPRTSGSNLLLISLADVHVGKLCVKTETGYEYDQDVATHRIVEGTKALLRSASGFDIGHILFVMGNDILHIDSHDGKTTAGTNQNTAGTIQSMFTAAKIGLSQAIEECAKVADVTLMHAPSNHDWQMGWGLSQTIGERFGSAPNVSVTDYNLSERHRKYFRFGNNLIGISHGDGAKEADLYPLMITEARDHISECDLTYWYLGHVHHKVRKRAGLNPNRTEKDLTGMTVMNSSGGTYRGDGPAIEYVRSPSPPDGWHDRNGYINRQAVECFVHHPHEGQKMRFSEWF